MNGKIGCLVVKGLNRESGGERLNRLSGGKGLNKVR